LSANHIFIYHSTAQPVTTHLLILLMQTDT